MKGGQTPIHIQRWAPADYQQDEHVQLLLRRRAWATLTFYRQFMDAAFLAGGDLPADPESLAACVRMPVSDVVRALDFCLGRLLQSEDGRIYQGRVRRDVAGEMDFRANQAAAGTASAARRWSGRSDAEATRTRAQNLAAARAKGRHTEAQWEALLAFTGRACLKCGIGADELLGGILTKDHIVMVSRGGSDAIDNIQPLCRQCNTKSADGKEDFRVRFSGFAEFLERLTHNQRLTGTPNPPSPERQTPAPAPSPDGRAPDHDNALVPDREALERECLRLVGEVAALRDKDPTEIMGEVGTWGRSRKINPATMTHDRLLNTVLDLRRMRAGEPIHAPPQPAPPSPRAQAREDAALAFIGGLRNDTGIVGARLGAARGLPEVAGPDAGPGEAQGRNVPAKAGASGR